ncbi:hypothetical protein MMC21_006884 [Puttea exsequens]|nr:hypothetical protein [Puttea exsequens]
MNSILNGLNTAQLTAATSDADVLQVLAPPGSGKTKTLTSRVAYLVQHHHYQPWNIICLTFTIKSSREMRERIAKMLGNGIESRIILGTFHSVCRRYLVRYGHLIGIPHGFGIADSSDTISIIKRTIKRLGSSVDPRKIQARISSAKSRGLRNAESTAGKKKDLEQQDFSIVYQAYEEHLEKSNLLDYDDLLLRTVDLLSQHPACVSNVEAVLIDEFQDTNVVQFDLMRLFAAKKQRVTTVGDPDQSIYGWRSAEIKNLKRMQRQYLDTLVINLEDNYRSSGAILLAAQEVIEQDESRPSKRLAPTHCPSTVPVLRMLPSADIEGSWMVVEMLRIIGLTGNLLNASDFAILLRSAAMSRHIETALGKAGVPYRMVGGQRFFDRVEIKVLLDYLRVVSQPQNNDAISRVINIPARGLGATTAKGLLEEAEAKRSTLWAHIRDITQGHTTPKTKISKAAEQGLGTFSAIILASQRKWNQPNGPRSPEDLLRYIIKKLDYQNYLQKNYSEDHETRWTNVEDLVAQAAEYPIVNITVSAGGEDEDLPAIEGLLQQTANPAEEALSKFLANVALATELQREDEATEDGKPTPQVTISTIHAAKGLEWPVVFVPCAYEGCIPHSRAEDTDEERRLLYVAMTRAQALLYLSCPTKNSQREETTLSPFLAAKKVGKLFSKQGPSINSNVVSDIARILNRESPSGARVMEASNDLRSREDNLWPLNGEEDVKTIAARWSKWDTNAPEHPSKRRRTDANSEVSFAGNSTTAASHMRSTVGTLTTMQSASNFSCGSGFISAAEQLSHIRHEKAVKPPRKISMTKKAGQESAVHTNLLSKSGIEQRQVAHGTLMDMWGINNRPKSKQENISPQPVFKERRADPPSAVHCGSQCPETNESFIPINIGVPTARNPLSSIPQSLSTHRLAPLTSTTHLHLPHTPIEPSRKQYVFLSSSPPPIEAVLEEGENEDTTLDGDVKPVTTFHTTSVAQAPKKTLGVKRSMNGWSARQGKQFVVPRLGSARP